MHVNRYIACMTIWRPSSIPKRGPKYLAIVDALATDIAEGTLVSSDRLPTQRELAARLGVTVTTVTRAYAEATRRGLVQGEVGRGTFVRAGLEDRELADEAIDLSLNTLPPHAHVAELAGRLGPAGRLGDRMRLLDYQPPLGLEPHRAAASAWIRQRGWDPAGHDVALTAGAQHALLVALMTLLPRGGELLVEEVTYSGLKQLAADLGVTLHAVALDPHGLSASDLDAVCRRTGGRVLYAMPALQNPTGVSMPRGRQEEIADVIRRHDLTLIEDDTYGFLVPEVPPLAALVPERTVFISSLSKSLTGGLRIGHLVAPPRWRDALASSIWNTVVMASPVTAEIATSWMADGTAARIVEWKRAEIRARQAIVREVLARGAGQTHPASPHVWLTLDRQWRGELFASHARSRGVLVTAASAFAVREGATPRAVRVAVGPPRSRERLRDGLTRLTELMRDVPSAAPVL